MTSANTNNENNLDIEEGGQPHLSTLTDVDVEVEQQTIHAVPPPLPDIDQSNQPRSIVGLEQVDEDDTDMPLPMGMAEEPPKLIGKVEQMDVNDLGPEPPTAMLEASLNAVDRTNKVSMIASLASINNNDEHNPPTPFDSTNFEQDNIAKKKAKDQMNRQLAAVSNNEDEAVGLTPSDEDSIYEPPREVIEGREGMSNNTNTGRGGTNRRGWDDIESRAARRDIESQTRTNDTEDTGGINILMADANVVPTSTNQGLPEVEAYLVEDIEEVEVFIATPTLPWWKQRRTKIFFGIMFILVGTLAIVLGIELSKDDAPATIVTIVNGTDSPSISLAPSSSSAPSSSPTKCVDKIISNAQRIDLVKDLQINDPRDPKVAIDTKNMVVVALDRKYYDTATDEYDDNNKNNDRESVQNPVRVGGVATTTRSSCSTSIAYTCNTRDISATQRLKLTVSDHDDTNYDATVIFHWKGLDNNLGSKTYVTGQDVEVGDAHTFDDYGTYYFVYTVIYGDDVGCADRTRFYQVSYPSASADCTFDFVQGSNVPTSAPIAPPPAFITFYSMDNDDEWQRVQTPIRVDDVSDSDERVHYSVALSGTTAFIGFHNANNGAGTALVYEQNQFNEWVRVDEPFVQTANTTQKYFGSGVDIDGELACVSGLNGTNLYHQDDEGKWVQFDTIEKGDRCSISGNTISLHSWDSDFFDSDRGSYILQLYKFNQDQNEVSPIQDPIPTESVSSIELSNDYLVCGDKDGIFIYYRDKNQTSSLLQ